VKTNNDLSLRSTWLSGNRRSWLVLVVVIFVALGLSGLGSTQAGAARSAGEAYTWGDNGNGQLGNNNTPTDSNVPVAVNTAGTLAGKTVTNVTGGEDHACALTDDGRIHCWGAGTKGQLGNNTIVDSPVPVLVNTTGPLNGKAATSVAAGDDHTCAINVDGAAACWGQNTQGALGDGTNTQSNVPVAVTKSGPLSGKSVTAIAGGDGHTCAVNDEGKAACWGDNTDGKLGNGVTGTDTNVPVAVITSGVLNGRSITSLTAGEDHNCVATQNGTAACWGDNSDGSLGNANLGTDSNVPVPVDTNGILGGKTVTSVAGGDEHTCALTLTGGPSCWGENEDGQLGTGATGADSGVPVAVLTNGALSGKTITSLSKSSSANHQCAATTSNPVCWGENTDGQLGNGTTTANNATPSAVTTGGSLSGKQVTNVAAGEDSTVAATGVATVGLEVDAKSASHKLKVDKKTKIVKSATTSGEITKVKTHCYKNGNKLKGNKADKACKIKIKDEIDKTVVKVKPKCSKKLKVKSKIVAKDIGEDKNVWKRTWKTKKNPKIAC
jgi:alpha-tubulin suppressor-like RCC1 family protein